MPRAYTAMLQYFQMVVDNPQYESVPQDFPKDEDGPEGTDKVWASITKDEGDIEEA